MGNHPSNNVANDLPPTKNISETPLDEILLKTTVSGRLSKCSKLFDAIQSLTPQQNDHLMLQGKSIPAILYETCMRAHFSR